MQRLLYMLSTSEYAWGRHLQEFAEELDSPLKEKILSQSHEEIKHGRILSGQMKFLALYPRVSRQTKSYNVWEIYVFKDEKTGYYSQVIGGNQRLATLRFVLGKPLREYSLSDRLAFAQVVELMGWVFYNVLCRIAPSPLNAAARAIAADEAGHKSYLFEELKSRVGWFRACLLCAKWLLRFTAIAPVALKEFLWG